MGAHKEVWTSKEVAALTAGVEKYGPGKWRAIQKDPKFGPCLTSRSNVDLKDKWRNINGSPNMHGLSRSRKFLTLVEELVPVKSLALIPTEPNADVILPISALQPSVRQRAEQILDSKKHHSTSSVDCSSERLATRQPADSENFSIHEDALMADMDSQVVVSGAASMNFWDIQDPLSSACKYGMEFHGETEEAPKDDEEAENGADKIKWGKKGRFRRDKIEDIGVVPISFHVDMLSVTVNELRVTRPTSPPLIPLCRIIENSAVRIAISRLKKLKDVYKSEGYNVDKDDFVLSLTTAKGSLTFVKDYVKTLWDPTWEKLSAEFDDMVLQDPHWSDLHGCMFVCWDGNHRLLAWMEAIHEEYMDDFSKHAMVRATFIQPNREGEMQLLASMNQINKINEVGALHTDLKDQLYCVRRLAECSPDYFQQKFSPKELNEVEKIRAIEAKRGNAMWFPMTPYILAQILFENDINKEITEAHEKAKYIDTKNSKTLKDFELAVQLRWASKMSKMLGVVNPSLGAEWFKRVTSMEPLGPSFHLSLEKLHALRCANVTNEVRNGWLAIALGSMREKFGVPVGDRDFKQWLAKETWFTHLLGQARILWANLKEVVPIPLGKFNDVIDYFLQMKMKYRKQLFAMHEPDMDYTQNAWGQVDIQSSAKRLLWRYVQNAVDEKEISRMPQILKMWSESEVATNMYSNKYHMRRKGGMTEWEVAHCPWWLDFPEGVCPDEERALFEQHQKDKPLTEAISAPLPSSGEDGLAELQFKRTGTSDQGKNIRKKAISKREQKRKEVFAKMSVLLPKENMPVAQKRRREEYTCNSIRDLSQGWKSHVAYVYGDVLNIGRAFASKTLATEMSSVLEHMRELCRGPRRRRGKPVSYSADFILMDFPTGFIPDGFFGDVPPWNIMTDALLDASLQLADALIDDDGWIVCIFAVQHAALFYRSIQRSGLQLRWRTALRGINPFGVGHDGIKSHVLDIYILSRFGATSSPPKGSCDIIDPSQFDSGCDMWTHYFPATERHIDPSKGLPYRGGVEKNPAFIQFLLELYCKKGGVVFDPFVGCGSTIRACRFTGRHIVAMDNDHGLLQAVEEREGAFMPGKSSVSNALHLEDEDEPYATIDLDDLQPWSQLEYNEARPSI